MRIVNLNSKKNGTPKSVTFRAKKLKEEKKQYKANIDDYADHDGNIKFETAGFNASTSYRIISN